MSFPCKLIKRIILILSIIGICFWLSSYIKTSPEQQNFVEIFEYNDMSKSRNEMKRHLHDHGFIAIRGVPGYVEANKNYIKMAREFVSQPEDYKSQSTTNVPNAFGWSEAFDFLSGKIDSYKGSYYANIPDMSKNVWPSESWSKAKEFKESYITLANVIFTTGKELLPFLDLNFDGLFGTCRMLHYKAIPEGEDDGNPNWCGKHRDYSLFTGLTPATYIQNGKVVERPIGSGLHIKGKEIRVANDILLFQVGEAIDLLTSREIVATDHSVKKAFDGHERFAFALFFNLSGDFLIHSDNVDPEYENRFTNGMSYAKWCELSLKRYSRQTDVDPT